MRFVIKDHVLVRYNEPKRKTLFFIPHRVTSIGDGAFAGCCHTKQVYFHTPLQSIGENAFEGCGALETIAPANMKEYKGAFFPEGLEKIGQNAFEGCSMLESVSLPDSLDEIGEKAFCHCYSLVSFTMKERVKELSTDAFNEIREPQEKGRMPAIVFHIWGKNGKLFDFPHPFPSEDPEDPYSASRSFVTLMNEKRYADSTWGRDPVTNNQLIFLMLSSGFMTPQVFSFDSQRHLFQIVAYNAVDAMRFLAEHDQDDYLKYVRYSELMCRLDDAIEKGHYEIGLILLDLIRRRYKAVSIEDRFQL